MSLTWQKGQSHPTGGALPLFASQHSLGEASLRKSAADGTTTREMVLREPLKRLVARRGKEKRCRAFRILVAPLEQLDRIRSLQGWLALRQAFFWIFLGIKRTLNSSNPEPTVAIADRKE